MVKTNKMRKTAIILSLIAFLLVICALFGCNPIKRAQKQQDKAISRVLTNDNSIKKVADEYYRRNPVDTGTPLVFTKYDTIKKEIRVPYPVPANCPPVNIDTTIDGYYISYDGENMIFGVEDLRKTETIYQPYRDKSFENRLQDSLMMYKRFLDHQEGVNDAFNGMMANKELTIDSLNKRVKEEVNNGKAVSLKAKIYWWIIVLLLGLNVVQFIKSKFKIPFL